MSASVRTPRILDKEQTPRPRCAGGFAETDAALRYPRQSERPLYRQARALSAQNRAEQIIHHPFGVGNIMRGGVIDGICEVRVAEVEVTVAEVVVPDTVL